MDNERVGSGKKLMEEGNYYYIISLSHEKDFKDSFIFFDNF